MVDHLSIRPTSQLATVDDPAHRLTACGANSTVPWPASKSFMAHPRDCGWLLLVALHLSHEIHDGRLHRNAQDQITLS